MALNRCELFSLEISKVTRVLYKNQRRLTFVRVKGVVSNVRERDENRNNGHHIKYLCILFPVSLHRAFPAGSRLDSRLSA